MQGLVTVFGGSGFLGRYVVRALARSGWRVRVAVRRPNKAPELRVMGEVGQIELSQANIRDEASVARALEGAEACVNLVGVGYQTGPQKFEAVHVVGARTIAAACAAAGISRLVHISVLGADAGSASPYLRTKAEGEAAVRAAVSAAVILRPSFMFGPEDSFFNRFAAMATMSPVLPLLGGGHARSQPVYAGDVGAAVAEALERTAARGRTFELGGPGVYSLRELMEMVLKETGRRRALAPLPTPLANLLGLGGEMVAMTPFPPPITRDQVTLLTTDNVVADGAGGLEALGVTPTAVEALLPTYLWTFRKGGQFAQPEAQNA